MNRSLVTRLTLLMAAIIAFAFVALVMIVHKSASDIFVEVRNEETSFVSANDRSELAMIREIEQAFAVGKWPSVVKWFDNLNGDRNDDTVTALVIDEKLNVVATTEPGLFNVDVSENEKGLLNILWVIESERGNKETELLLTDAPQLVSEAGVPFGRLVLLPANLEQHAGNRFAQQLWRSAGVWLALTLVLAMLATAVMLRRSLQPLQEITNAARKLQSGTIPGPLENKGDAEFDQLIDAFNSATQTLADTEAIRKQLIADIAHELRTPLTNIKGQLEAAEAGLIPIGRDLFSTLNSETRSLEKLVDDFQELAISDAGQLSVNPQRLPLLETLQNVLAPMAKQVSARVNFAVPQDICIKADEQRLRQVLGNLMENATCQKPTDLTIHIGAERDASHARIVFSDNGPGIDPQDQPFIFDRFYRAEKSRNRSTGGSGLGLAIVRALLEAMDGSIRYLHDSNQGAKFEIRLPLDRT